MSDAWEVLLAAGVPGGAIRRKPSHPLVGDQLRIALEETAERLEKLDAGERDPLLAWLSAWKHHWPQRFRETLGEVGEQCLDRLREAPVDANRYLKQRRIAIENLSQVL